MVAENFFLPVAEGRDAFMQHVLNFFPEPQGQGSFLPTLSDICLLELKANVLFPLYIISLFHDYYTLFDNYRNQENTI